MAKRIVTGAVSMLVLLFVSVFYQTVLFPAAVAFFVCACIYEALTVMGIRDIPFLVIAIVCAAGTVLLAEYAPMYLPLMVVGTIVITVIFAVVLYETVKVEIVLSALAMQLFCSLAGAGATFLIGRFQIEAPFYLLLMVVCAWISDMGAYFVGTFFGKHKMAPVISPKKTVEGLGGGILFSCIAAVGLLFAYRMWANFQGFEVEYHYLRVFICAIIATLAGVVGDLFASVIKRAHGVKDFGNLFPGMGGALDRFDSILVCSLVITMVAVYTPLFRLH